MLHLKYLREGHNYAGQNERAIEVPLGLHFIQDFPDAVEVGAVLPYYRRTTHTVIDLVDALATVSMDALDFDFGERPILSISSLEHFGFGDFSNVDVTAIPRFLKKLRKNYLLTVPLGYNPLCDSLIKNLPVTYYSRKDWKNTWERVDAPIYTTYNTPFPWANTIAVISDLPWYGQVVWHESL